jgi:hypothetical protein
MGATPLERSRLIESNRGRLPRRRRLASKAGGLDQRFGKTVGYWNEAYPLVSPRILASKQCVCKASEKFARGLFVLEYNYLQSCWYLREAPPKSVFNAGVNLFISLALLALLQRRQRGIDHDKAWMGLFIAMAIPQQTNNEGRV